jgi:flagellar basal-body rod protein FlgB
MSIASMDGLEVMQVVKKRLNYLVERQNVIAQNISNANTPQYRTKDVQKPDFGDMLTQQNKLRMKVTSSGHLPIGGTNSFKHTITEDRWNGDLTPMGNNVVLEEQIMKQAETGQQYNETIKIYNKVQNMLKKSIEAR